MCKPTTLHFTIANGIVTFQAVEVVHELAEYLSKRYPDAFTVCRSAWGHISSITIVPVNDTLDLPPPLITKNSLELRQVSIEEAEHALRVSALL